MVVGSHLRVSIFSVSPNLAAYRFVQCLETCRLIAAVIIKEQACRASGQEPSRTACVPGLLLGPSQFPTIPSCDAMPNLFHRGMSYLGCSTRNLGGRNGVHFGQSRNNRRRVDEALMLTVQLSRLVESIELGSALHFRWEAQRTRCQLYNDGFSLNMLVCPRSRLGSQFAPIPFMTLLPEASCLGQVFMRRTPDSSIYRAVSWQIRTRSLYSPRWRVTSIRLNAPYQVSCFIIVVQIQ